MSRLIIYAGFHKTGTSAIQAALRACSAELEKVGIHYAVGHGLNAQHRLAKLNAANTQNKRFNTIKRLTSRHSTVLLASEFFSEQFPKSIQGLKDALGPEVSVEVIFSYRRLEKVVASQYQQFVRIGYGEQLGSFARAILQKADGHHEARLFWRRHSYSEIVERWSKIFGPSHVHLVVVDEKKPEVLVRWFEKFLGLAEGVLEPQASSRMNRSLDLEELALVSALQEKLGPERMAKEWKYIYRDQLIAEIAARPSNNPKSLSLRLDPEIEAEFVAIADREQLQLAETGAQIYGDFQPAQPRNSVAADADTSKIHIDTVARAIVAIGPKHYLRQVSVGQILRELIFRTLRALRRPFTSK